MNDVSNGELKLRQLDRRDLIVRAYQFVILFAVIGLNLFMLAQITQLANSNSSNIKKHSTQIQDAVGESQARQEIGLCIFSVSPIRRTPEYVKSCYDQIEEKYHVKIQRFGDGIK